MARLGANHRRLIGLSRAEQALAGSLGSLLGHAQRMWQVPRLEGEVHDIDALGRVFEHVREVNEFRLIPPRSRLHRMEI